MRVSKIYIVLLVGLAFIAFFLFSNRERRNIMPIERDTQKKVGSNNGGKSNYGVSADNPLAVKVGMEIMERGGNAVDAAVAVSYVLGVVEPYGSGIGGGGGTLIYPSGNKEPIFFDYREIMPFTGNPTVNGVGVPGFVAGMEEIHREFGSIDIKKLIEPSVKLAEEGFQVNEQLNTRLKASQSTLPVKELASYYPNGKPIAEGAILKQKDLAKTLKMIGDDGSNYFYKGEMAQKISNKAKGLEISDLSKYSVIKRKPVKGKFSGYTVWSAPPPFAGVTLIQSLQMAELLNVKNLDYSSADYINLLTEIIKKSYQDRQKYIADPDFIDIPLKKLTDQSYSLTLSEGISTNKISDKFMLNDTLADIEDHENTTHFVIVDKDGMMVSTTNTLSNFFGSGIYVEGFFMNNQLYNFSNNSSSVNKPQPGKRPRSFLSPTILTKNDKPVIGIGTPGGKRIPSMVAQVLIEMIIYNKNIQKAIEEPRFFPDAEKLYIENDYPEDTLKELNNRGYNVNTDKSPLYFGGIQSLVVTGDSIVGGADSRRNGTWQAKVRRNEGNKNVEKNH